MRRSEGLAHRLSCEGIVGLKPLLIKVGVGGVLKTADETLGQGRDTDGGGTLSKEEYHAPPIQHLPY